MSLVSKDLKGERNKMHACEEGVAAGKLRVQKLLDRCKEAERMEGADAGIKRAEYYRAYAECYSDNKMGKKALGLFTECAQRGFSAAWLELGHIYDRGEWAQKDERKSLECYEKALQLGDGEAAYYLGQYYEKGGIVEKDLEKAVEIYRRGVELGAADAKAELGIAYFEGKGVLKDYVQAFYWLRESYDEGENKSGYYLAISYFNGLGTGLDEKKGFIVLEQTVAYTFCYKRDEAKELLINCYEKGIGTERNMKKADVIREKLRKQKEMLLDSIRVLADEDSERR